MWNTFKYTVITLLREKTVIIWSLVFPLVMATLFNLMFSDIDNQTSFNVIPVGIVDDAHFQDTDAFVTLVERLSEEGDDQTIEVHYVATRTEAEALLNDGIINGFYAVDSEGTPHLSVSATRGLASTGIGSANETILKTILDNYLRTYHTVETTIVENPAILVDETAFDALFEESSFTTEISIFANEASGSVRYFYALFGFASIMVASVGLIAATRTQGNLSAIGARRMLGSLSRTKTLVPTLAAAWVVSFFCLTVAFLFTRFVLNINFGGRDLLCIFALLVASLMTTSLGAFVGSIPKLSEGSKSGFLTALSCILALFAGLYGPPSQRLADDLAKTAPLFQTLNPSKQVSDLFYDLYYYYALDQFFSTIFVLLAMAAVLLLGATLFMRRQRYASL